LHEDRISDDLQITAPFFQIKAHWAQFLLVFSGSLPKFSGILQRFSQIFAKGFTKCDLNKIATKKLDASFW